MFAGGRVVDISAASRCTARRTMGHLWCLEVVAISSPSALGGRAAAKSWWPLIFMASSPVRMRKLIQDEFACVCVLAWVLFTTLRLLAPSQLGPLAALVALFAAMTAKWMLRNFEGRCLCQGGAQAVGRTSTLDE